MNQAVQFPDWEEWNREIEAICFPVLVNGMSLTCAIHIHELKRRFGNEHQPVEIFQTHRWDLEDEAQALIEKEQDDDQGWVWLSCVR